MHLSRPAVGADLLQHAAKQVHARAAPHLAKVGVHGAAATGTIALIALALALLLLACLFRSTLSSKDVRRTHKKMALPAFDVEGGSSSNGSSGAKVLHPTIAEAAKHADIATLRSWMGTPACAVRTHRRPPARTPSTPLPPPRHCHRRLTATVRAMALAQGTRGA